MESTAPPPVTPSSQPSAPKKGLGMGAKIGIGCGAIVLIAIIAIVIGSVMLAPKLKGLADELQKNPTRAAASLMVTASGGAIEMVAEDDVNKRYTVKETKSGTLTTIYWDEKSQKPQVVEGDFSAIPVEAPAGAIPATEAPAEP